MCEKAWSKKKTKYDTTVEKELCRLPVKEINGCRGFVRAFSHNEENMSRRGHFGDGDPRMRKFQKQTYTKVSHEFAWMEILDFPIRFGLNSDGVPDFLCSDALHMPKKLRNNSKYLSTHNCFQ